VIVRAADLSDPEVLTLLKAHLAGMHAHSPPGSVHALEPDALRSPDVSLYAVWEGADLMAIGALQEIDATSAEIKSMRTAAAHLRRGSAAFLLEYLMTIALSRGYHRLSLETGSGPAFEPALALYRRYGFENGQAFGGYEASPFNQFMHLQLCPDSDPLGARPLPADMDRPGQEHSRV
jgi:putative acetyltransferase